MWNKGFEGWYFKHQCGSDMVAFIPGRAESGAFVQMITADGSRQFDVPELTVSGHNIRAGNCLFCPRGCEIDLPGVHGELIYGRLTPLRSDVMGPFRFVPMECRHGVLSMAHTLSGGLLMDGTLHRFDGGTGYMEMDSGTSFPTAYQWLQCNDFSKTCCLLVSIARIPFCGTSFTGCICAIIYRNHEYRLATYNGVRILAADETHICLAQRGLLLEIDITPSCSTHPLRAPIGGHMTGTIREGANTAIHARLWAHGKLVFDLRSPHAAYEFVLPEIH